MIEYIFPLGNFYGQLTLVDIEDGTSYLALEDYCGENQMEVPKYVRDALYRFYKEEVPKDLDYSDT